MSRLNRKEEPGIRRPKLVGDNNPSNSRSNDKSRSSWMRIRKAAFELVVAIGDAQEHGFIKMNDAELYTGNVQKSVLELRSLIERGINHEKENK